MIAPILSGSATSFAVTSIACDGYNTKIQNKIDGGVLTQCVSWYRAGGTGKVTNIFPGPVTQFWWWLRRPVWGDYEVVGGERWRKEMRAQNMAKMTTIIALMVVSIVLRRDWDAVKSRTRGISGVTYNKVRSAILCIQYAA